MPLRTLSELFLQVAARDQRDCLLHKVNGRYFPISSGELAQGVRSLSRSLEELGIGAGDRVALMAENGPHWPTVDFATLCLGAVLVPIYPTLPPQQAAYVVRDSGSKVVFVHGHKRLSELLALRSEMPDSRRFILIEERGADKTPPAGVTTLAGLCDSAREVSAYDLEARAQRVEPEDLATLIYTSGTTGNPKGVMLTHGNIVSNVLSCLQVLDMDGDFTALSFLPLSHSFERTTDYLYFYRGCPIAYAESIHTLAEDLKLVNPHVFVSVPRVYEKVLGRVHDGAAKGSPLRQKIFRWAVQTGYRSLPYRLEQRLPPGLLGLKLRLADRLVFAKIRSALGDRFRYATSGGGPLARDVAEFFWGAGVPVFEGYGLTETSPVITVNTPGAVKLGSVGRPIPGVEVRIAEDGEILARGPNIMQGYFGKPEATNELMGTDGWFKTGDIGELDQAGFLTITDRKKEILVNAYGKNIAPAPIENSLKSSRFVDQAVVIGDRRKFLSALIVPDFEALENWSQSQALDSPGRHDLLRRPEVVELFQAEVDSVNDQRAPYEEIRAFELIPEELTVESGVLTPTQKIKRRIIDQRFKDAIDRLYDT